MPTITSSANASVKAARSLQRRRRRAASGRFLVEGPGALAAARSHLEQVFVAPDADTEVMAQVRLAEAAGAIVTDVTAAVLASLATTATPRGAVGVARLAEPDLPSALGGATFAVLCHEIADPGNAGTILRTADAAAADAVVFSADSVDPRNAKAVRASAGSIFHLPVVSGTATGAVLAAARDAGLRPVATAADGAVPHTVADFTQPVLLVLGGEARGLPDGVRAQCDETVRIDMFDGARPGYRGHPESLNLAATFAVLAFEVVRQRTARAWGAWT